jgi:hypothetical protein
MNIARLFSSIVLGLSLSFGGTSSAHAQSATEQLKYLDKTTFSGSLDVYVSLYAAPDKNGKLGAPQRYPAKLIFERPDRFRLVLRPGAKDEFRAVAEAGVVRWLDLSTGFSGKEAADKVTDPFALALLGAAGEMLRFAGSKDVTLSKDSKINGAIITPKTWGATVERGIAWLSSDGRPIGFEFQMRDRSRVFVSVLSFKQNVKTVPGDFQL